ncbi:hypothetical protein G6F70_002205 [Rhizopus microsporus]|uniref:Uncharacterized protein n=1 Tax=Rhizopus azygosporus TaxID=86630 RepID=A0A367INU8_RHIAZ|nr:hypothetical protein G6F71_002280 [Rhizopus microsporus]RCH79326.1 hypothetical protein CU097_002611 [Rhizopus azygosporus]KAG1202525.1 hypothetical protein G6F70_002205 [Rhizopus microsporus]KAG1213753.1 hypothetical protein G6F69_002552 [Rhizopus microsporus]KAG1235975.1 hypothetical protein G6F67_002359 [Rhizopus microsporus]
MLKLVARVGTFKQPYSRLFYTSSVLFKSEPIRYDDLGQRSIEDYPELIIGWSSSTDTLNTSTFVENRKFTDFLTKTLKENIHKVNDTNLKAMADWQKEGWMHIGDERDPPAWGRINFPEDIVGSVQLVNGVIQEGTYQPMPAHRLISGKGIFQLSEPLTQCVIRAAKAKVSQ